MCSALKGKYRQELYVICTSILAKLPWLHHVLLDGSSHSHSAFVNDAPACIVDVNYVVMNTHATFIQCIYVISSVCHHILRVRHGLLRDGECGGGCCWCCVGVDRVGERMSQS